MLGVSAVNMYMNRLTKTLLENFKDSISYIIFSICWSLSTLSFFMEAKYNSVLKMNAGFCHKYFNHLFKNRHYGSFSLS